MAARALTRSGDISPGFFTWLASDGWGKQSAVVNEIQEFAVGAITVELESKKIHGRSVNYTTQLVSESQSAIWNSDTQTQEIRRNFFQHPTHLFCLPLQPVSRPELVAVVHYIPCR